MIRSPLRTCALALAALTLAACAGRQALAPVSPERAHAELAAASAAFASQPSDAARLRLGEAQYRAGDDSAARATLRQLLDGTGDIAAHATLFDAAAAERMGDLVEARSGYESYLAEHDDRRVRARLAALARREADAAARAAIASERSLDAAALPAKSVGVAPLAVSGVDSSLAPLGYGLADLLITDLARSAQLQVVDRTRVEALLRELDLAGSGRVDSATAPRVGRLVGARRIVNGAIGALPGGRIAVSARIADASTASLVGAPITARTSLDGVLDAEKALAFRIFDELGVTLTPAERAAVEQRPTRYLSAFLAYSRGVRSEALGDFAAARAYFERAVMIDPGFGAATERLTSVPAAPSTRVSAAPPPPTPPAGVVDAVNPSPAGSMGTVRDPGNTNEQASFSSGDQMSTILIGIWTP